MGTRCANHVTPLYPQKLALTSPAGGGRSVGMVRSRTKATEFSLVLVRIYTVSNTHRLYMQQIHPQSKTSVYIKMFLGATLNCGFSFLRLRGRLLKILIPE